MENGVADYIPWIVFVFIFADYFLLSVLDKMLLRSSRDNYRWIRRESGLLNALVKDYNGIEKWTKEINKKANEVWESELGGAGIRLRLDDSQRGWLITAKNVAKDAKELVTWYESLMSRGDFRRRRRLYLINLMWTFRLSSELKKAKKVINDHLEEANISIRKICKELEHSSKKVRSLKDRPIDETKHQSVSSKPYFRSGAPLVCTLEALISQKALVHGMGKQMRTIEVQMQLQNAFMKDLRGFRLESEIENAWAIEAQQLIVEREDATETFFKKIEADRRTSYWPLSTFRNWMAWRKLKANIKKADSLLSDLLKAKERYGFTFIRRESSKFSWPNALQPNTDDTGVSSPLEHIELLLNERRETISTPVCDKVEALLNQLEQTQSHLKDMEAVTEGAHYTRKVCIEQLKKMASDAENSSTELINMGPTSRMSLIFPFLSRARSKHLSEIDGIEQVTSLLIKSIQQIYRIEMVEDLSSVVGLEEDIHELVSKLTSANAAQKSMVVSIVGMKGIGKTTLAKEIYNHTSVANHFAVCHWFSLQKDLDENSFVVRKIKKVLDEREVEKQFLLVLDKLISKEAWNVLLKGALEDLIRGNHRLKILITTRKKEVASYAEPGNIHQLRLRTKEESWELFTQMVQMPSGVEAPLTEEEETPEKKMEALAKKAVRRTGGLPLAILHLGYLFAGKKVTAEVLLRALELVTRGQNQALWREMLEINKEDIKSQQILGKCLSSFEIIPFNFEIPARRVVALWVARGLIQSEDTNKTPEDVAYKFLSELIDRNMIQVVERKLNGKVKTCRFPTALRELWLQRPRDGGNIRAWSLTTSEGGQLAYHFDDNDANHNHRIHGLRTTLPSFLHEERNPRSILFFDTREGNQPGQDIRNFLQKGIKSGRFHGLLVLDLEGVFRPHLPRNIGELKQLAYLGLRWTYLDKIPPSIGELLNLQTLDVKYTYIRTLPISVWKLKKLRHLYLNEYCRIKFMPKPSIMCMEDLQTLSGAFLDDDSPFKDGLDKLNNLRKLGLIFQLTLHQQTVLADLILQLTQLRSLSLSSVNEKSKPQDLKLNDLSGLQNLSVLYLFGMLERPDAITRELPESLTELILSASGLEDDPMLNLGRLPNLKSLSFFANSYKGQRLVCSSQSFPQLLDLKLWNLSSLTSLIVKEGAMKSLREMEIRSCTSLIVSTGLIHLKTLQELKLTNMPKEYVALVHNEFSSTIALSWKKIPSPKIKVEDFRSNAQLQSSGQSSFDILLNRLNI